MYFLAYIIIVIGLANYVRYKTSLSVHNNNSFIWVSFRAFIMSLMAAFCGAMLYFPLASDKQHSIGFYIFVIALFGSCGIVALLVGIIGQLNRGAFAKRLETMNAGNINGNT